MMIGKIRLLFLAASMFAAGLILTPSQAEAAPYFNIVTHCEPDQPYPGHQRCTRYHYNDGILMFTSVYYVDENGMWYRI